MEERTQALQVSRVLGTNTQFSILQLELKRLYKKVTGLNLVESRLLSPSGVLDVIVYLENIVFGVVQQGLNLVIRVNRLTRQVNKAAKYIVSISNPTPTPGSNITVTAQLADSYNGSVKIAGLVVAWSSTTTGLSGTFSNNATGTNNQGKATVVFTVSANAGNNHTVKAATTNKFTGTSPIFTVTSP